MKHYLIAGALLLAAPASIAQALYIKAGGGYGFPHAGQTINNTNNSVFNGKVTVDPKTGNIASFEVKPASLQVGAQGQVGIGLPVNEHLALELNATIGFNQKKTSSTGSYPYVENNMLLTVSETYSMYAETPIVVSPAIKIQTGGKPNLYARVGLSLPVKTSVTGTFSGTISNPAYLPFRYSGTHEYNTKFGIGFNGALGISANTAIKWLKVFGEANFNSLSLYVKERNTTEYRIEGNDAMHLLSAEAKKKVYGTESSSMGPLPTYTVPFSSIGVMVGVAIVL